MSRSSRPNVHARWPFWLLLAAWFCANSPQAVTYELIVWLGDARSFSHQQRLSSDVASVLAGQPSVETFAGVEAAPAKPFAPPIPADATLKKIELAVQDTTELLPPAIRRIVRRQSASTIPDARRAQPPHEPPRTVAG